MMIATLEVEDHRWRLIKGWQNICSTAEEDITAWCRIHPLNNIHIGCYDICFVYKQAIKSMQAWRGHKHKLNLNLRKMIKDHFQLTPKDVLTYRGKVEAWKTYVIWIHVDIDRPRHTNLAYIEFSPKFLAATQGRGWWCFSRQMRVQTKHSTCQTRHGNLENIELMENSWKSLWVQLRNSAFTCSEAE